MKEDSLGSRTYGKGKIQNIFELQDGSALFVTVARYQTPNYGEIDGKGASRRILLFLMIFRDCTGRGLLSKQAYANIE